MQQHTLGTEAIRKLEVEKLPVIAIIDVTGKDLYEGGDDEKIYTK